MTDGNKNKKTVEEVAKVKPGLFKSRLAEKTVEYEGVTFHLRTLPALLVTHIRGAAVESVSTSEGVFRSQYVRYGVADIKGLTDENGEPVEFELYDANPIKFDSDSPKIMCVPEHILNGIHANWHTAIFWEVLGLTHLGDAGKKDSTSTTASDSQEQTPENGAE